MVTIIEKKSEWNFSSHEFDPDSFPRPPRELLALEESGVASDKNIREYDFYLKRNFPEKYEELHEQKIIGKDWWDLVQEIVEHYMFKDEAENIIIKTPKPLKKKDDVQEEHTWTDFYIHPQEPSEIPIEKMNSIIERLTKIANILDKKGLFKEADELDLILNKISEK